MPDNVDKLFEIMQANGAANDRDKFRKVFLTPGNKGYKIRKDIYDGLRADGIIDSPTYEDFRRKLRLGGTPTVNKYRQQLFNSVDPNKSRASEFTRRAVNTAHKAMDNVRKPVRGAVVNKQGKKVDEFDITPAKTLDDLNREYAQEVASDWEKEQQRQSLYNTTRSLDEVQRKIAERDAQLDEADNGFWTGIRHAAQGMNVTGGMFQQYDDDMRKELIDPKYKQYLVEANYLTQMKKQLIQEEEDAAAPNATKWDRFKHASSSFTSGMVDEAFGSDAFDFGGYNKMRESDVLLRINDRINRGVATDDDRRLLQILKDKEEVESRLDNDAYSFGRGASQSAGFVTDFLITGGGDFGGLGRLGGKMALGLARKTFAKTMTKDLGKRFAAWSLKNLGKTLGEATGAAMTATSVQIGKTAGNATQRYLGLDSDDGGLEYDKDGNLKFKGGTDVGTAIAKAIASGTIENYTELLGPHITSMGKRLFGWGGVGLEKITPDALSKFFDKVGSSELFKRIGTFTDEVANSKVLNAGKKALAKVGVNDMPEEGLEEEAGIILNSLITGDNKFSDLWDKETQYKTWGGVMFMIGAMRAIPIARAAVGGTYSATKNKVEYFKCKHNLTKAETLARQALGDKWTPIKELIDNADNKHIIEVGVNIIRQSDKYSQEQAKAAQNYIGQLLKMRGFNNATMASIRDKNAKGEEQTDADKKDIEVSNAYAEGHESEGELRQQIQLEYEKRKANLAKRIGLTPEKIETMNDASFSSYSGLYSDADFDIFQYKKAKAAYDGVMDNAQNLVDIAGEVAAQRVDNMTNVHDGTIRKAFKKGTEMNPDSPVYIISGNIELNDDGSINYANSDKMIVIYDEETGQREAIGNFMLASVDPNMQNAEEVKAQAIIEAKQKIITEQSNVIDGILVEGSEFSMEGADGITHNYNIVQVDEQGNCIVSVDGTVLPEPLSLEAIQQQYDQSNVARSVKNDQTAQEPGQTQQESQPIEDKFDYSKIANQNDGKVKSVVVTDEEGKNRFPNAKAVFLIQDKGAMPKFVVMDEEGNLTSYVGKRGDKIHLNDEKTVGEYKKQRQEELQKIAAENANSSMIEGNSGENRGEIEAEPIGTGAFGNIYNQFKGKVKEAFSFLMSHKSGDLLGVFHRDDVGDIDLVWGNEKMGLAHILGKHVGEGKDFETPDDAIAMIENVINSGRVFQDNENRYTLMLDGVGVGIRKSFDGERKNWVVTAVDFNRSQEEKGIVTNPTSTSHGVTEPESAAALNDSKSKDINNSSNGNENNESLTFEDGTPIPVDENGEVDLSQTDAAHAAEWYDTNLGEDADDWLDGEIKKAKKVLEQAQNKKLTGTKPSELVASKKEKEAAIADAQARYDSAISIRDSLKERRIAKEENTPEGRKNLIDKARRKFARLKSSVKDDAEAVAQLYRDTVGSILHSLYDGTGIDVTDTVPLTAEEYVASNLGAHTLNYEGNETSKGVKQETGLSRENFAKTQLLAADGKGTTIDNLVHSLWENRPSNLDSLNTQDIRNALIGVLTSGFKASEARSYVENIRIAQAEKLLEEQELAAENAAYAEQQKAKEEEEKKKAEEEDEETSPLEGRITETDEESEVDGEYGITYNKVYLIDGDKRVTKVDEPDEKGDYTGSYYMYDGKRFGDLSEVADYIDGNNSDNINEKTNENTNFPDKLKEGSETIEVPEDATDEKPLGEQRTDSPFSARKNGKQQTEAERAADVEKNKVDDIGLVGAVVGEKIRKAFERIAKMMGAEIQYQRTDKLGNGWIQETKDADGNVHRTIFITLDSSITEGAQFIFGHEMTHQIKNLNPAAYNELTQLVLDTYGSDAFDKAVDKTMQRYSDAGFSGRERDYYAEEVVADAVGEMIRDLNLAHTLALKMSHPLLAAIHEILQKIKLAFFGTEYSDVTKNIIRSIEQAYVKTANGQVTNSETGEDVSFSLRQKPEPKKKGVGYKVFVLKDGKLYPPMVANPYGAATPVGVWLDADAAPIAGESKTGRPQVKQGGKGTQGGSGKLAYRPGWHLGVVPYAIQFNRKDAEGNKTLFPKNFVFAEVEYAADVDYQEEARQEGINPSGKYQHSLAGLKHLPTDGYYMYRTNPNPETDPWVITGAMKVNRILTRAEQAELVKNAGREPQQIQEGDIVTDDVVNSINQEIANAPKFSLKVYHGSGADFTEFDFDHMGEGAGSQAFGWGGYVTSSKKIGKDYARLGKETGGDYQYMGDTKLTSEQARVLAVFVGLPAYKEYSSMKEGVGAYIKSLRTLEQKGGFMAKHAGERIKVLESVLPKLDKVSRYDFAHKSRNLYEVDIPEDNGSNYLDFENPMSEEQINAIRDALAKKGVDVSSWENRGFKLDLPFKDVYAAVLPMMMRCEPKEVSKFLSSIGYTGIKYPAGTIMGGAEEDDTNYVIFKPEDMKITEHTKFSLRLKSAIEETETNPSDAQKESGNYKKGHIKFGGYDYTIENPKGSIRSGKDANGKEWKVTMHDTYGYIRGKYGKDGDHLDMFINDKADLDNWNGDVFVVDQVNPDGSFDEHKVMYGYDSMDDAEKAYLANYSKGWKGLGNITGASKTEFDKWLDTSNRKLKPFADYAKVKFSQAQSVEEPRQSLDDIKPVSVGAFGNIYNQFRGKAKAAIEFLKKLGSGEATAALHHHTIGDISLVWGDKKTGLDKILRKHPEVVDNLQSIIDSMEVVRESDNRIKLESPTHFAVVSKEYKGEPREQWLLTAYEKRESLENGKSMDTATSSLGGDTALSQSKGSAAKIDNSSETSKENGEKVEVEGTKFSLKDEKTMFGMHNISVDKLRKAIKQGGFAAPSMGVVDSKNGIYSGYGEITLIPKAEKIAKRTGKNIGTYAADAWTPIYPPVEKKFGGNGSDVAYNDIESVPKEMQRLTRNAINSFMDGREANGLAYLYLQEKGKTPELVHVEGKYPKKLHDEVKSILGKLDGIYSTTDEQKEELLDLFIREVYDGNREEFDNDIKKIIKKDEEFIKKRPNSNIAKNKQLDVDWMKEHGYDYGALSRFVDGILRDAETSGKVDENATMKAAQQYIQDNSMKEDFDSWKEKLNDRYNVEEVIFAGYKPDGNRKYLPNTVENAVKVMKQDGKNASVGSASFSHFVASILKPMGTLDQIRKKKGNLTGNYEDVEKFQEKWQPVYDELADKMQPDAEPFESYGMDRLEEAATQKNPKKYAKDEYGVDLTDEDIDKLNELIDAVKNEKPSIYFETKFMRPYGLDEFEKAIVPNDTPSDVVDALKMAGIDVSIYERGNAEDRQNVTMDAINSSDNIRFSLKSMMEKPEGWKQANKKAIHIAEAIERDPKFSLKNLDGTLIKAGTYFSGGGLVEEGLKGIIDPVVAVEYDEKISGVYRNNFGQHIVTADVRDVDPKELVSQIDGEVEYFHASPVCKNYSQAKSNHAEVELDKETAASTADFINAVKPKVVTIENVKGYKDSDAMKTITDALDANGYTWDADVYNAADYGGYTNRERLIVRAVRDGKLPAKPKKMARKSGWYEAVADIIPILTEKKNGVAPWMDIRLKADGIDWRNIDKPLYVMGSAYADGKIPHAFADELLPTLRTKSGDVIVMPDGKVYRAMGRVLARVSGVSDDYKMPFSENLSHTIIGNGIPTQLTEHVIAPLLQNTLRPTSPEEGNTRFSLRGSTPYDKQMEEWMEKNHLEKGAVPMEKPIMGEGENIFDYANRMVEWTRNQNLWKTAPKQTGFQDALEKWKADNSLSPDAYPPVRPHRENYSSESDYAEDLEEYNKKKELWKSAPKPKDFDLSVDLEDMNKQLRNIRRAVLNQKNYDQRTVKAVSDLVRKMLNIGWGDGLSRGKVANLLSAAKNATGANDVKKYLDKAMGILAENYLNRLSTAYDNLINTKGARADQSGVIKMGSLDADGQAFMSEYKRAINMDDSSLNTYIANIEEDSAKNEDNVEMNDYRLAGIQAAIMFKQQIGGNDADIAELQRQIGELKNKKDATKEDKDLLKSLEKKLFENKFDRITMYENLLNNIQRMVKDSKGRAKEFREEIAEHKNEILHRANLDLEGVDSTYYDTTTAKKKLVNNDLQRAVFSSTYTFEQFLKFFGKKAANGEGYLYNYFTKLNQDALDEEQLYNEMNRNALDEKTKELFGKKKFMKLVGIDGKGMKEMDIEVTDYSNKKTGKRTIHLKQGQMLYIYLVNKETDGEMKLRAMGITEEDVAAIEENLDPRVKAMGEWLQDEYLPECQRRYQATHTKYFGAPMKEVENYFPLAINNRARNVKEDVNQDSDAMSQLAGTSTGAIVTRRVNVIPLDIENADAFEVAFNHLQEMEEWSAMLPFRQDVNTLLSYTHFRNQVQNMSSVAYGSGKTLWDEFKQTAQIAAGTYKPKVNAGMMDSRIAAAMGGIAVAKISGRLWTAIKQSQSATVFLPECDFTRFVKNGVNPYGSWKWAMENIPDFRKRVENMTYGDVKLRQYLDELEKWHDWTKTISKIGMAPNILVDGITCAVGARSVYETEVNRLTKLGYPKEKAEEKAYYKAVAAYNKTQQSSGGMYLSPMQVDRTYASAALSLFKNANYAYGRMQIEACRGLARTYDFWGGKHKTALIESMTRQIMEEDGLDENTARAIAKATYNRTFRQSIGRLINFATLVPISWALYKVLPYLLTGDDDDKKKDMIEEAVLKGFATSLSDNYVIPFASNILNAGLKVEDGKPTFDPEVFRYQNLYINPATSDLANIYSMVGNQKWYSVANKLGMLGVQSLIGFNPETVGALYQALSEADNDNGNTAKEWQIGILKAISAPEESIRELYMDELGLKSGDIKKIPLAELEKRYAERQINRDNLLSQVFMDAETFNGYVDKYQKSFEKKIKDKMDKWDEYDKKKADEFFDTTTDPKLKDMIAKKRTKDANAAADEQIAKEGLNQEKKGKEPSEEAYDAVKMSIDVAEDNAISTYNKVLNKRYAALNDEYNNQTDAMKYIFMSKHPNFKAYKDLESEYTTYGKKMKELKEKLVSAEGYDAKQTILKQIRAEREKFSELQSKVR